jgi:hypothetical protein
MKIVRESLNIDFNREGTPLEKLKIGKKESDLIFIKEHEWDLSLPHILKRFTVEELIRDFKGIPILVLKSDSLVTSYIAISTDYHSDHHNKPEEAISELKLDIFGIEESLKFTREGTSLEKIGVGRITMEKEVLKNLFRESPSITPPENVKNLEESHMGNIGALGFFTKYMDSKENDPGILPIYDSILQRISEFTPSKFDRMRFWIDNVYSKLGKMDLIWNSKNNWINGDTYGELLRIDPVKTREKTKKLGPNKAFSFALKTRDTDMMYWAIENGATNLNIGNNEAIQMASEIGDSKLVKLLLKDPIVDPVANTTDGKRYDQDQTNFCIRRAVKNGHLDVVRVLLEDGRSDPAYKSNSALSSALLNNDEKMCKLLLTDERVNNAIKYMGETSKKRLKKMGLLVKESLSFERNGGSFSSLNIGIINQVQKFMEDLKKDFPESRWDWKINEDLSIDIFFPNSRGETGIFDISIIEYSILPSYIKFNIIDGEFDCSFKTKESLKSFPSIINRGCRIFSHGTTEFDENYIKNICDINGDLKLYVV